MRRVHYYVINLVRGQLDPIQSIWIVAQRTSVLRCLHVTEIVRTAYGFYRDSGQLRHVAIHNRLASVLQMISRKAWDEVLIMASGRGVHCDSVFQVRGRGRLAIHVGPRRPAGALIAADQLISHERTARSGTRGHHLAAFPFDN
jgi:hypothetical protein